MTRAPIPINKPVRPPRSPPPSAPVVAASSITWVPVSSSNTPCATIVGDNTPDPQCVGTLTSGGGNLDSDKSCGFTQPTDIGGVSPQLDPLASNGGPTATHAPMPTSPAIDAAVTANCAALDQRGVARPQGGACDIGAYEAP